MSRGLLGFLIAVSVALIGFLIYFFFLKKKKSGIDVQVPGTPSGAVPPVSTNPIAPQDTTTSAPVIPPVINMPTGDSHTSAPVVPGVGNSSGTFDAFQYEVLKSGDALSQRSNNPGALFWDGSTNWQGLDTSKTKKGQIIYFTSVDYGVRAQCMTLKNYSKKHGINTLNALTARYAPLGHGDNNPVAYAQTLASYIGIEPTDTFNLDANRELLAAVAYFIHRVEAGYFWVPRKSFSDWAKKV